MIVEVRQNLYGPEALPGILQDVEMIRLKPAEKVRDHQVSIFYRLSFFGVDVQADIFPEFFFLVLAAPTWSGCPTHHFRAEGRDHP